jgi:16S rRNA (cytosine967-C5)-methyltransferase
VLRQELRRHHGLSPEEASFASRAVFSYFRWYGWLKKQDPLHEQLDHALELADAFARRPESFSDSELMALAIPGWVVSEVEVSPEWLRSLQTESRLWLRARSGQGNALAKELGNCELFGTGRAGDILCYQGMEDLFRTPAFQEGRFEIQDLSSQAVGLICNPQGGEVWWDACSGEGGKTLHLSDLMENKGLVWASDRAQWRLQRLKRRAARARVFNYRIALWDGQVRLPTKTKFNGVLVDGPCTGIGTWQRNPHARWTTTPQDVRELALLQMQLVSNAAAAVKRGGKLFYSVCTLTHKETSEVAKSFESRHPEFSPWEIQNPFEQQKTSSNELCLWPQHHKSNGMFIAGWVKR